MYVLSTIAIGINPNIFRFGPFLLSWHGFLTFVAVAVAVYLTYRWGTREGMNPDAILSVAVWGIIGGIIGARVLHIIDFWGAHIPARPFEPAVRLAGWYRYLWGHYGGLRWRLALHDYS